MDKTIIIGGGFSALIAKLLLGTRPHLILSAISRPNSDTEKLVQRPSLELNKWLSSTKAPSLGSLQSQLAKGVLHDRLIHGGNSQIWGGFCNANLLGSALQEVLRKNQIYLEPLSFAKTGSLSNDSGIAQLTDQSGRILNAAHLLGHDVQDGYATQLMSSNPDSMTVALNSLNGNTSTLSSQSVILAVGTVQLIDLLYRSNIIQPGDELTLTEFEHRMSILATTKPKQFSTQQCVIRYQLTRALYHALGIQKIPSWLNRLPIPLYVDQCFDTRTQELRFQIQDGSLVKIASSQSHEHPFGGSIHYCNLRVNGVDVNTLLRNFSPRLIALGMPALKQGAPGPISNDIMNDAAIKIQSL